MENLIMTDKRDWRHFYQDPRWKKARSNFLAVNKICNFCGGKSNVVDHITPHKGNWSLFCNQRNWQPLCKLCHDSAKKKMENRGLKAIGANEDGFPIDPDHLWNQK